MREHEIAFCRQGEWRFPLFSAVKLTALGVLCAISLSVFAEEKFGYDALGRLIRAVDEQGRVTTYSYDAASNLLGVVNDSAPSVPPVVASITPDFIHVGETKQVRISGNQLIGASVSTGDPKLTASVTSSSAVDLTLNLSAAADAVPGVRSLTISNPAGSATISFTVRPALSLNSVPSLIVIPPDASVRVVTIRLSDSDSSPLTFNAVLANDSAASVSPNSITLNPGQTEFQLSIVGRQAAKTSMRIFSPALAQAAVFPVYVSDDSLNRSSPIGVLLPVPPIVQSRSIWGSDIGVFMPAVVPGRIVDSLKAVDVGVSVTPVSSSQTVSGMSSQLVGVGLGLPQVMSLSPSATSPNTTFSLVIRGSNLFDTSAAVAEPSDGITFTSLPVTDSDGARTVVNVSVAPDATAGPRVIRVVSPAGTSTSTSIAGNTLTIDSP